MNLSSCPIANGSPFIPKTHFPSHWDSCGQTLPHTAGKALYFDNSSKEVEKSPFFMKDIKLGIFTETGQP